MDKLITVIVPVYNVEQYLDKTISSICEQTYKNLEILLINDGSTDDSGVLCDNWQKKDTRIRVFHQENKGVSGARNKGLDAASGSYIMFVDADDWLDNDTVQTLFELLTKQNVDISCCQLREVHEGKEEVVEPDSGMGNIRRGDNKEDAGLILLETWGPVCKLYRRQLLKEVRFQPYRIAEDLLFNTDIICNTEFSSVAAIDKKMYNYFIRGNSAMKQKFHKKYMESMYVEADCYDRLLQLSSRYGQIDLVSCGVRLFYEKYAQLSWAEKREYKVYFNECKQYMKEHKEAILGSNNKRKKILGTFKVYMPNLYMFLLSLRYRR